MYSTPGAALKAMAKNRYASVCWVVVKGIWESLLKIEDARTAL
jgi:hypothetical protein